MIRIFLTVLALAIMATSHASETLHEIEAPRGVAQKFLLIQPEQPKAIVILFAGGKGALNLSSGLFGGANIGWGKNNFLVRTREDLAGHGLMVATVDAPGDHQGKRGMLGGFRSSSEHVTDIDAVIARLREIADLPVWLIGTSRGTESATNLAINSTQRPAGLVLTSSMTDSDSKGQAVPDFDLSRVRIPVLITHHQDDGCRKTRPAAVGHIGDGLVNAPVVEVKWFSGGREQSKPCKAMSYHGYLGIEKEVIDVIAAFVLKNS